MSMWHYRHIDNRKAQNTSENNIIAEGGSQVVATEPAVTVVEEKRVEEPIVEKQSVDVDNRAKKETTAKKVTRTKKK